MDYTRNKLRHKVLPTVCQEVNSQAVTHIVAAGIKPFRIRLFRNFLVFFSENRGRKTFDRKGRVIGCRISEFYKITDETQQILQVKTDGGEEHGGEDSCPDFRGGCEQEDQ